MWDDCFRNETHILLKAKVDSLAFLRELVWLIMYKLGLDYAVYEMNEDGIKKQTEADLFDPDEGM